MKTKSNKETVTMDNQDTQTSPGEAEETIVWEGDGSREAAPATDFEQSAPEVAQEPEATPEPEAPTWQYKEPSVPMGGIGTIAYELLHTGRYDRRWDGDNRNMATRRIAAAVFALKVAEQQNDLDAFVGALAELQVQASMLAALTPHGPWAVDYYAQAYLEGEQRKTLNGITRDSSGALVAPHDWEPPDYRSVGVFLELEAQKVTNELNAGGQADDTSTGGGSESEAGSDE